MLESFPTPVARFIHSCLPAEITGMAEKKSITSDSRKKWWCAILIFQNLAYAATTQIPTRYLGINASTIIIDFFLPSARLQKSNWNENTDSSHRHFVSVNGRCSPSFSSLLILPGCVDGLWSGVVIAAHVGWLALVLIFLDWISIVQQVARGQARASKETVVPCRSAQRAVGSVV